MKFSTCIIVIFIKRVNRGIYILHNYFHALTGETRFECLFILYGMTTRNGKGTLCESILRVMGDYGRSVKPETLA